MEERTCAIGLAALPAARLGQLLVPIHSCGANDVRRVHQIRDKHGETFEQFGERVLQECDALQAD